MQKFYYRVEDLGNILKNYRKSNIFLITGGSSFARSGAENLIKPILASHKVTHFRQASPNPDLNDVELAVTTFRHNKCDLILAIGGGSVIDVAKATLALSPQKGSLREIIRFDRLDEAPSCPMIAIPTTAGSGSESTHFAAIYIDKIKYSISHEQCLASIVILDAHLTYSLSPEVTATSGMDAITQAIESYWSVRSSVVSRGYSRGAINKLLPNIERAVFEPSHESRLAMLEGANLAGRAINISKTTACHAMSYGLTAHYGVSHGQAASLTLPNFILFNTGVVDADCRDKRGTKFVRARMAELLNLLGAKDALLAKQQLHQLIKVIGLQPKSHKFDTDLLIDGTNLDRLNNNPRIVSRENARSILASALNEARL